MTRRHAVISGIGVAGVALGLWFCFEPYYAGSNNCRSVWVPSALDLGLTRPFKPFTIRSHDDIMHFIERIKEQRPESVIDDPVRDEFGFVRFEQSLQMFDFSKECLVIIPVTYGHDYRARMKPPHLQSRKLTVGVWVYDPQPWPQMRHPASRNECFGIAVKKDAVDQVDVWVRGEKAASLGVE